MRRHLGGIWGVGRSSRSLGVILAAASGGLAARLPEPGTWGTLVIAADASLEFCDAAVDMAALKDPGFDMTTFPADSLTTIGADDVEALNIRKTTVRFRDTTRFRAVVLEVALGGGAGTAGFAVVTTGDSENEFGEGPVPAFVRRVQWQCADLGLPKIHVTKTLDRDCILIDGPRSTPVLYNPRRGADEARERAIEGEKRIALILGVLLLLVIFYVSLKTVGL
jgi:hypothetical protein